MLKEGDVVKIDLGAHIDGFIAVAANTVVAKANATDKVTGRAADVILATYWASQAALRLLKPGTGVSISVFKWIQLDTIGIFVSFYVFSLSLSLLLAP